MLSYLKHEGMEGNFSPIRVFLYEEYRVIFFPPARDKECHEGNRSFATKVAYPASLWKE